MPGIIGFYALVVAAAFVVLGTAAVWALCRFIFNASYVSGFFSGLAITLASAVWLGWLTFGEHHNDIGVAHFESSFSELAEYGATGMRGHEWISGLSDGDYYKFSMEPEAFRKFTEKYSLKSGIHWQGNDNYMAVAGGIAPDWIPKQDCRQGEVHYSPKLGIGYFSRFNFYYCPVEEVGYMARVRI